MSEHFNRALRYLTDQLEKDMEWDPNAQFNFVGLSAQLSSMQIYTYPDGDKSIKRPSDKQIHYVWDSKTSDPKSIWQWEDATDRWIEITPGAGTNYITLSPEALECECGSEKCGSSKHSSWCAKYQS